MRVVHSYRGLIFDLIGVFVLAELSLSSVFVFVPPMLPSGEGWGELVSHLASVAEMRGSVSCLRVA